MPGRSNEAGFFGSYGDARYSRHDRLLIPEAHTASATLDETDFGKLHTNRGASGAVVLTLPAPKKGAYMAFAKATPGQTLTLSSDGTSIYASTGMTAGVQLTDTITTEYAFTELISDGTAWFQMSARGTWVLS